MAEAVAALDIEDSIRSAVLRATDLGSPELNWAAQTLADEIDARAANSGPDRPTLASAHDMWRYRAGLVVAASPLISQSIEEVRFATVNPRGYTFSPDDQLDLAADRFKRSIRADLDQICADMDPAPQGWIIAGLHGEHRPDIDRNLIHWHGLLSEEMVEVVDQLRTRPKYAPNKRTPSCPDGMRRRVWIDRKPITLPGSLTYCAQQFWPSRWVGEVEPGRERRARSRSRMPDRAHALWLLWMGRQRFSDLILLYHCRVRGGLVQPS